MDREELLGRYAAGERDFSGVDLSGANLKSIELVGVDLSGANLSNVMLCGARLIEVNLSRSDLSGANLDNVRIMNSDLTQINMSKVNLIEGYIETCSLDGANLREAILGLAYFARNTCKNVIFDNASLIEEFGFENSDFTGASFKGCDIFFPDCIPPGGGWIILPSGRMVGERN